MNRKTLLLVAVILGALAVVGCSGAAASGETANSTVRVVAKEWSFTPSVTSVRAGQVTVEFVNQGKAEHEMVLLKTDLPVDALKIKANGAEVDESASGQIMGEVEDIGSGQTKALTLNLAPGRYVLTCNIIGHYKAGMATVLEVS